MRYSIGFLVIFLAVTGCKTTEKNVYCALKKPGTKPPIAGVAPSPTMMPKVPINVPLKAISPLTSPALVPSPGEVVAQDASFDVKTGKIIYTLAEPALVRIRIGLAEGGPLLRTLVDWEEQGKGKHELVWDKMDSTGKVFLATRPDVIAVVAGITVDPKLRTKYEGKIRGFRKSPGVSVSFPTSTAKTKEGVSIVSGVVPMKIVIDEKDVKWVTESKFEVSVFVDTTFLMEDEEGTSPFTYQLNTKGFADGPHMMTANIVGYSGEVGTASVMIQVQNKK